MGRLSHLFGLTRVACVACVGFIACGGRALLDADGAGGATGVGILPSTSAGASNGTGTPMGGSTSTSQTAGGTGTSTGTGGGFISSGDCDTNQDCTIFDYECCPNCQSASASQLNSFPVKVAARLKAMCSAQELSQCRPCASDEYTDTRKYMRAVCAQGTCSVIDVRGASFTSCSTGTECTLRAGVDCCPHCEQSGWVPVNKTATFCDVATVCPPCASAPPPELQTLCQAGTCRFVPPPR